MKFTLSTSVLLLMSSTALASVQVNNCWGNGGGCTQGGAQTTKVKGGRRSLQELFQRDPDFEFAMGILARNANAAEKTVDQIVTDIKKGTVDQAIVNAALSKGLIIKAPGTKRSAEAEAARGKATGSQTPGAQAANSQPTEGNSNHISGPKGEPHSTDSIAQHILTDGYIPPKIKAALIASKFYLAPGQKASNPTTSPKGRKGASKGVTQGSNAAAGGSPQGRQQATSAKDPRDLEDSLYIRDIPSIYAREAEAEAEAEAYAYAEAEAHFTMEDMRNLVHATESNPIAEKAVYNALTMDPNVERVSEGLVRDWVKVGNNEKRDVYDEYYY